MRIYIVGAVSSGKSTFGRQLSAKLQIPYQSLDELVHIPDKSEPSGNRKRSLEERYAMFASILSRKDWIMEDVGRPCFAEAQKEADLILLLELPARIRRFRIIKRWIKQRLRIERCIYKPTFKMLRNMLQWSKDYDTGKDNLKDRIALYKEKIIILRNNKDISKFLINISKDLT